MIKIIRTSEYNEMMEAIRGSNQRLRKDFDLLGKQKSEIESLISTNKRINNEALKEIQERDRLLEKNRMTIAELSGKLNNQTAMAKKIRKYEQATQTLYTIMHDLETSLSQ